MRPLKIALAGLILVFAGHEAQAGPRFILYQGRYLNNGAATSGSVTMEFRITNGSPVACATPVPAANLYWTSSPQTVATSSGVFSYKLGLQSDQVTQDQTFLAVNWASTAVTYYIDVCVAGANLTPNEPIGSMTYAIFASSSGGLGNTGDAVVQADSTAVGSGAIRLKTGATDRVYVSNTGGVGIGTTSPGTFSLATSSGVSVASGVYAGFFVGNGAGLTGITGAVDSSKVAKAGDTMTGQLTLSGSSLTVTGNTTFSITASSGVSVASGVYAGFFVGNGAGITGITGASDNTKVLKTGDAMTGPLTMLSGSTITVSGEAFSVGGSSFSVAGGSATVAYRLTAGSFAGNGAALTGVTIGAGGVDFSTITAALATNPSTYTILGNAFSVGGSSFSVAGGSATVAYRLSAGSFAGDGAALTGVTVGVGGVDFSTITAALATNPSTYTILGNAFSVGGSSFSVAGGSATVAYQLSAGSFIGSGAALTGIPSTGSISGVYVQKAGDAMTGQLTLSGSTLTVTGNAFSVGASTLVVVGGNIGIGVTNPSATLEVGGRHQVWPRTRAQIDTLAATALGQIIFCSDCALINICVSTGTAASQWRRVDSAAAGCGSGD